MEQQPEGLYTNVVRYPPEGLLGSVALTQIQRAEGDGTITTIIVAPSELPGLISQLERILQRQRSGEFEPK